ncbi:MAG: MMPL family transporter [Bdellovibrionota bacterium]
MEELDIFFNTGNSIRMLLRIENLFLVFYRLAVRYPKTNIFFTLTIFLLCAGQVSNLKININTKDIIEKDSVAYQRLMQLEKKFELGNSLYLLFQGAITQSEKVGTLDRWLRSSAIKNREIVDLYTPFNLRTVTAMPSGILYPHLLASPCESAEAKIDFSLLNETPWRSIFTSKDSSIMGLEVFFRDAPGDGSKYGRRNPVIIENFIKTFENFIREKLPEIKPYFLGSLGYLYYSYKGIKNTEKLNLFFLILIVLLCRIFFGTFKCGLLVFTTLVLMGGILYGLMAIFHVPLDILSNGLFLMIGVSALEDFIFLSSEQLSKKTDETELFPKFLLPSFLTSLTTIIGFGSLYFTDITVIKRFGLWASIGSLLEWLLVFFFLPSLMTVFPKLKIWTNPDKAFFQRLTKNTLRYVPPTKVVLLLLIFFALGGFSLTKLNVTESPVEIFPQNHPYRRGMELLKARNGWEVSFDLVFSQYKNRTGNLSILEKIATDPLVIFIQTPYEMEDFFTKDLSQLSKELVLREFTQTKFYRRFISANDEARAVVFLNDNNISKIAALAKKVESLCDGQCHPTGEIIAYSDFSTKVPRALIDGLGMSIVLVCLTLAILAWMLKANHIIPLIISSMWGPFTMLTIFWLLKIPLNFLTCVFANVLVGLTGDNAIQYLFSSKGKSINDGIADRGEASIQIFLVSVLSATIFQLAYFQATKNLGMLLVLGLFAGLFGDLWLLKGLIQITQKKKEGKSAPSS